MRIPDSRQEPTGDKFQLLNDHHYALCLIFYTVGADGSFIDTHCFKLLLLLKNCRSLSSISTFHRLYDFPFMYNAASSEINISNLDYEVLCLLDTPYFYPDVIKIIKPA